MQIEINAWLKGDRDYYAGVKLFEQYGSSKFMVNLLSSGPDSYNTPKLLSELQILLSEAGEELPAVAIKNSKEPEQLEIASAYIPDKNLEKKLRIDSIIKQLWKEICHLHGQLGVLPEGEKLYECARQIKLKDLKRQDLWDQLHYYQSNGVWFDELPENIPKPYDLEQAIDNLMSSRSKARKILKKPLTQGKRDYQLKRIAEIDRKIADLKKLRK